ncbi:uncharacterized protein LOC135849785 [Planococcus citri]|uniref:uncharacterized protein LOC135849785 n=1 Tax=Planococcus citri TaxID=170843 RepID=UPI0031F9A977
MAACGKLNDIRTELKSVPVDNECLNAVRALHQTVVCLRTALERSQSELHLLKKKVPSRSSSRKYDIAIEQLSLENHVLRRKILAAKNKNTLFDRGAKIKCFSMDNISQDTQTEDRENETNEPLPPEANGNVRDDSKDEEKSDEDNQFMFFKTKTDSEESEEVDDIELIFTTEDTKVISLHEELEPISDDGEPYESKSEINHHGIATQSVLVETDISKCGIVYKDEDTLLSPISQAGLSNSFRNALKKQDHPVKRKPTSRLAQAPVKPVVSLVRPVLNENNASMRDSEAQTDISAVPPSWKSESFLVNNKASQNFPTLPSKFAIPIKEHHQKPPLKLTEKTQEARRILLSDINFTSMVPELSRSVDHLCHNGVRLPSTGLQTPFAMKYLKSPALASTGSSYSRFEFQVANSSNSNWNCYENSYASDQDRSAQDLHAKRRQSWRPSMYSLDAYYVNRTSSVPPSPTLRRHSAALSYSPSANAETQFYYPLPDKFSVKTFSNSTLKNASVTSINRKPKAKVSFKESLLSKNTGSRQSLPNMYVDTESGEESTDSLIDESEECVRKSIDSTLTAIDWPYVGYRYVGRTHSVPNLFLEFSPPLSARPFIARSVHDLKINYFVKVINKEGRVVGGRIQFVGNIPGISEPYIGVLLPPSLGETDGTFQELRYFSCEKNCGLFVPFRKVVMAWKV